MQVEAINQTTDNILGEVVNKVIDSILEQSINKTTDKMATEVINQTTQNMPAEAINKTTEKMSTVAIDQPKQCVKCVGKKQPKLVFAEELVNRVEETSVLTLHEPIDVEKINAKIDEINKYQPVTDKTVTDKSAQRYTYHRARSNMCDILKNLVGGVSKVEYYVKSTGRMTTDFCKPSIGVLPSDVRKSILSGELHEIDQVNCHPSILAQLCINNGIECDKLTTYVENRDKCMEDTGLPHDDAKAMFISLMALGDVEKWYSLHATSAKVTDFARDFSREMKEIVPRVCELYPLVAYRAKTFSHSVLVSSICESIEREISLSMIEFCRENNMLGADNNTGVVVCDAILVPSKPDDTRTFLDRLEEYVYTKTGFRTKLAFK